MPLFWIVHDVDGVRRVFIQEASWPIYARLKASFAGLQGEFVEMHELHAKRARNVPKI